MENDYVVEQLAPHRTHQALADPILPWAMVAGPRWGECHGGGRANHRGREDGIPIEEQIPGAERGLVEGESLTELLDDPGGGWELGNAPVQDLAAGMADGEPDVEQAEGGGGHHEEVHGDDEFPVVSQKGEPALPELGPSGFKPAQVARDRAFGDLEPELQELAMDSGSSPAVLCGHPVHQVADLATESRSTRWTPRSREPLPVQGQTGPVPGDDGLGFHDDDGIGPLGPEAAQQDPE